MTQPANNKLGFNGEFNLRGVTIVSSKIDGLRVDITNLFAWLEVYESIYSPFMTIRVGIIDTIGIMDTLRMVGEEYIEIDLRGPSDDELTGKVQQMFYIYKISDRTEISDRGVTYTFECISPEALVDMTTKISKAFNGQPSEIAKEIVGIHMQAEKPLVAETTKNTLQYISNYWSPMRNMKFLADRSVSASSKAPAYVFYETTNSFIYTSLNRLIEQPAVDRFYYTINTKQRGNEANKSKIIEKIYVDKAFDYIERLKTGGLGNRSLVVDTLDKTYSYKYYDYFQAFDNFARLNEIPMGSPSIPRTQHGMFNYRVSTSSSFPNMPSESNADWFAQRPTEYASLNSQTIQIDVPGSLDTYAGNIVQIYMYTGQLSTKDTAYTGLDMLLSGRYLITSIKHFFDRERHLMSLQLNKDSLFKGDE